MRQIRTSIALGVGIVAATLVLHAQQQPARGTAPAAAPPKVAQLVLRETFKGTAIGPQVPFAADQVLSPNLVLTLYGPGAAGKPDHPGLVDANEIDPTTGVDVSYVWSGNTEALWAVTLKDKENFIDLSGTGRIKWRARTRGFNVIHPVLKLADGTFLVGDYSHTESTTWHESEFTVSDVPKWRPFDSKEIVGTREGEWRMKIDLSKVDEIGWTDLSRGSGSGRGGNSAMDWIEVYGFPVKRTGS
jgi:hypothetical protein